MVLRYGSAKALFLNGLANEIDFVVQMLYTVAGNKRNTLIHIRSRRHGRGIGMAQWWESLSTMQRAFAFCALPATLILLIQTVLVLFGGHDGSSVDAPDADAGADGATDADGPPDGLALFSIRGIASFFAVGGWAGVALAGTLSFPVWVLLLSIAAGAGAMYGVAYLMKLAGRLQSSGTLSLFNALGKTGKVYIPIPEKEKGAGKVMLVVQERLGEFGAVTRGRALKTGETVMVVGVLDESTLIVAPTEPEDPAPPIELHL